MVWLSLLRCSKRLSSLNLQDQCTFYFFNLHKRFFNGPWYQGPLSFNAHESNPKLDAQNFSNLSTPIASEKILGQIPLPKNISPDSTFYDLLNLYRIKHLPILSQLTLRDWYHHPQRLVVFTHIPSPFEILELQAQGKRVLTLFQNEEDFLKIYEHRRNAYNFFVHDLEHAARFFNSNEILLPQKIFSQILLKSYVTIKNVSHDETYTKNLNYLISDMNTHIIHMLKYLKHIFLEAFLKEENKAPLDLLSESGRKKKIDLEFQIFSQSVSDKLILDLILKLGTPAETEKSHQQIFEYFYKLGLSQ